MTTVPLHRNQETTVGYDQSATDYGHFIVNCYLDDGRKATIGHIYVEVDGDEIKYISLNAKGREMFSSTSDFSKVEKQFERYARLFQMKERIKAKFKRPFINKNYSPFKKINPMKNQTKATQPKPQRENQLIFVEYEKMSGDGHFVTVVDSYRNIIGRIHKSYNDETKKYEYVAFDHSGKLMVTRESLWELKKEFTTNREQLLEDAHQRRIAAKEKTRQQPEQGQDKEQSPLQQTRQAERKKETEALRKGNSNPEKQVVNKANIEVAKEAKEERPETKGHTKVEGDSRGEERQEELADLREDLEEERGEAEMER